MCVIEVFLEKMVSDVNTEISVEISQVNKKKVQSFNLQKSMKTEKFRGRLLLLSIKVLQSSKYVKIHMTKQDKKILKNI